MPIYEFEGVRPQIAASAFVHPTAVIIGNVVIGENCFILPHVTIRGDYTRITIGAGSNIQDNSILHSGGTLGPHSHVGHGAIIHGATLGEHVLVGMGSIILDGAEVGDGCIVAAGSVLAPRAVVPAGKVVMGVPAAITGDVSPEREQGTWRGTLRYEELGHRYAKGLREISREEATGEAGRPGGSE